MTSLTGVIFNCMVATQGTHLLIELAPRKWKAEWRLWV